MVELLFDIISSSLIQVMGLILLAALTFRYLAYKSIKEDEIYFGTFARELERLLSSDTKQGVEIKNVDAYLEDTMKKIADNTPKRSVRVGNILKTREERNAQANENDRFKNHKTMSFRDYMTGDNSLMKNILSESSSFKAKYPPNFNDLTSRVMGEDTKWMKLFGLIPIESVNRFIIMLPNLFIVFGIFGTFIGINMALPEIARIDFANLTGSSEILGQFVTNVTFSMRTSIAGIVFSVITQVLATLFPLRNTRYAIFKKVETSLEMLWHRVQGSANVDQELGRVLPELLKVAQNIDSRMAGAPVAIPPVVTSPGPSQASKAVERTGESLSSLQRPEPELPPQAPHESENENNNDTEPPGFDWDKVA